MSIEITIVRTPQDVQSDVLSHIFDEQGGTIGRGPDNTWVVDDPERFISIQHSQIFFENGEYYLVDISTNGTFFNGAGEPIGNGNRVPLQDGDRFCLSDYEFLVSMARSDVNAAAPATADDPFSNSPFENSSGQGDELDSYSAGFVEQRDPFASSYPHSTAPVTDPIISAGYEEVDPLALLNNAGQSNQLDPVQNASQFASQPDNADSMQQSLSWPSAIPDDWDNDDLLSSRQEHHVEAAQVAPQQPVQQVAPPVPAVQRQPVDPSLVDKLQISEHKRQVLELENEQLMADLMQLKQHLKDLKKAPAPRRTARSTTATDKTLIAAMGLDEYQIPDQKQQEISATVGELMRETMLGLMQALTFRKKIKEEFRINVTTIQPIENNPLKFSANIDDALENMFVKDNKAYQKPLEAVRESFQGISEHQVAVLAGIQAAFRGMIERLDPGALEKRFEKYRKTGVIKVGSKGKNWDSYKEFHEDLVNNIDNSFQHLFGYDFVQAYEDQLQRLLLARKTRNTDNN